MRHILLAGAGLIAALTIPTTISAQTTAAEQQTAMASWPADEQAAFKTWPADYQAYYWTLTPEQQKGYWALNNEQRGQIQAMTPEQRVAAWQSIQAQLAGAPPPAAAAAPASPPPTDAAASADAAPPPPPADAAAPPPAPADTAAPMAAPAPTTVVSNTLPPPLPEAANKTYPLCSKTVQDSCQNRGEGGAPGVSRASDTKGGPPAYARKKRR